MRLSLLSAERRRDPDRGMAAAPRQQDPGGSGTPWRSPPRRAVPPLSLDECGRASDALPNMRMVALGPVAGDDDSLSIDAEQELLYVPSQAGNGEKIQEHTQPCTNLHEGEPAESC